MIIKIIIVFTSEETQVLSPDQQDSEYSGNSMLQT